MYITLGKLTKNQKKRFYVLRFRVHNTLLGLYNTKFLFFYKNKNKVYDIDYLHNILVYLYTFFLFF